MAPRHFADQHLAEHLQAEERDVGGLRRRAAKARKRPVLYADDELLRIGLGLARSGADAADARIAGAHRVGYDLRAVLAARALEGDRQLAARMRADGIDERVPVLDRAAVDAQDAIAAHEPGALGGAAGEHLAEHRLERRPVAPKPDLFQH